MDLLIEFKFASLSERVAVSFLGAVPRPRESRIYRTGPDSPYKDLNLFEQEMPSLAMERIGSFNSWEDLSAACRSWNGWWIVHGGSREFQSEKNPSPQKVCQLFHVILPAVLFSVIQFATSEFKPARAEKGCRNVHQLEKEA